jgi:branched-chain amino acid aminotransferase
VVSVVGELLRRNGCRSDTYIRPLVYKSDETIAVTLGGIATSFAAYVLPMGGYFSTTTGLSLRVSGWRRVGDAAIPARAKTIGSYVNAALASDEARRSGFDEALMLTGEGRVAEAASSNIFLVQDGRLVTPAETEDILLGITREAVLRLAGELGIAAVERPVHRSELFSADEVFLCGTGAEIAAVTSIDGRAIGSGAAGPVSGRLRSTYLGIVRGDVDDHPEWRTAVYDEPAAGTAVEEPFHAATEAV